MPSKKLEVNFTGTLTGFVNANLSDEEGRNELVLEAEQRINRAGDMRAHLALSTEQPDSNAAPAVPWAVGGKDE